MRNQGQRYQIDEITDTDVNGEADEPQPRAWLLYMSFQSQTE